METLQERAFSEGYMQRMFDEKKLSREEELLLFQEEKRARERERKRGRILAGFGMAGMGVHGVGELANQTIGKKYDKIVKESGGTPGSVRKFGKWGNRALLGVGAGMTAAGLYKSNKHANRDISLSDWKREQE